MKQRPEFWKRTFETVAFHDELAASLSEFFVTLRVFYDFHGLIGESVDIEEIDQQAVVAVFDELGDRRGVRCQNRAIILFFFMMYYLQNLLDLWIIALILALKDSHFEIRELCCSFDMYSHSLAVANQC